MFYRQKENKIISKILDHSGGVFSSGHGWGILGGRQGSLESEYFFVQDRGDPSLTLAGFARHAVQTKKAEPFLTLPSSLPGISRILTSFFF